MAGLILRLGTDPKDPKKTIDWCSVVEPGTVLAQIDETIYKATVNQAKANLQQAEANLGKLKAAVHQTERDWKRAQSLIKTHAIADLDYDNAELAYDSAVSGLAVGDATIAQCQAALELAEANLRYCTITSPVKGVIVDRRVDVGQTVVSSLSAPSLFLIAKDLKRLQVLASVNEADIGKVHVGQKVTFTVDAFGDEVFHGGVSQVRLNATMNQNVVTYTVVVDTDNSSGKLLPYMTTNAKFHIQNRTGVLTVPNMALRWQPQLQMIAPDARATLQAEAVGSKAGRGKEAKTGRRESTGRLWIADGKFVRPIDVQTGLNDGLKTEVSGPDVKEDMEVVVGEKRHDTGSSNANPFAPKLFGGKK